MNGLTVFSFTILPKQYGMQVLIEHLSIKTTLHDSGDFHSALSEFDPWFYGVVGVMPEAISEGVESGSEP